MGVSISPMYLQGNIGKGVGVDVFEGGVRGVCQQGTQSCFCCFCFLFFVVLFWGGGGYFLGVSWGMG